MGLRKPCLGSLHAFRRNEDSTAAVLSHPVLLLELQMRDRLANTPLETAYELRVVSSMTQLVQLELGVIFDGSSSQHDVPRALESLGELQQLQVRGWLTGSARRRPCLQPALAARCQGFRVPEIQVVKCFLPQRPVSGQGV